MTTRIITVSIPIPKTPEQRAQEYIDNLERKRARDEARTIRRCQKFADDLWNMALGGFTVFVAFAVLVSL
ncbi:MAG: hypothetical protein J6A62_05915 [Oscillospiraceae bacterium]|nr:hypothetical protein [Oscillospiraceae bacterium]